MFDVRPAGKSGSFGDVSRKSQKEHERSLVEALIKHENDILNKRKKKERKRREEELRIKKEASTFQSVSLDQYFSERDLPVRIISKALDRKEIEKRRKAEIEAEIQAKEKEKKYLEKVEFERVQRERQEEMKRQEREREIQREREEIIRREELIRVEKERLEELQKIQREREEQKLRVREEEIRLERERQIEEERARKEEEIRERQHKEELQRLEKQEKIKLAEAKKQRELEIKKKIEEEERQEKLLLKEKRKKEIEEKRVIRSREREEKLQKIKSNLLAKPESTKSLLGFWKPALTFSGACLVIFMAVFSLRLASYGMQIKDKVVVKGVNVVSNLDSAKNNFQEKKFSQVVSDVQSIQTEINDINQNLEEMEGGLPDVMGKLPFVSKYGSAKSLLEAGNEMAKAMVLISQLVDEFSQIENPLDFEGGSSSTGDFFLGLEEKMKLAEGHLGLAQKKIDQVDPNDLPEEYQNKIKQLKNNFPKALGLLTEFNQRQIIFKDLLGYNGPRKYLFLFQNNHEIRATGGFVGSYGVLSVHDGNVKELFVDGIFNPDGQLSERVVPPRPIQKISTNWSTHDANWYPDFPMSAEKIAWFYEKTGGPTVDGIITLTPTVMEKLLKITGPIEMAEYDVVVDADNFIEATQFEVEVDYDKEENRPKKFIADLTPRILDRVFSKESLSELPKTLNVLSEALNEKHILIYLENDEIQKIVSDLGWSGEVLDTPKDYLMVVNSNINGYKTDGVIDQKVFHEVEVQEDGSIIDTVTIERFHNGGSTKYEWWNKVNANYMRVYVPLGSELIEAEGYTRETVEPPVDYDKLGFVRDDLVTSIEKSVKIDKETGTEIWEEANKTVFGNWVYVSPQERVRLTYKYKLPFKLEINFDENQMDSYSVLYQKQSGMNTSGLESEIDLATNQDLFWKYPADLNTKGGKIKYESNLEGDKFIGIVVK